MFVTSNVQLYIMFLHISCCLETFHKPFNVSHSIVYEFSFERKLQNVIPREIQLDNYDTHMVFEIVIHAKAIGLQMKFTAVCLDTGFMNTQFVVVSSKKCVLEQFASFIYHL